MLIDMKIDRYLLNKHCQESTFFILDILVQKDKNLIQKLFVLFCSSLNIAYSGDQISIWKSKIFPIAKS